jgi:hypothetical protein
VLVVLILAAVAASPLTGCKPLDEPNVSSIPGVESTGTVQAELPPDATGTVEAQLSTGAPSAPAAPTLWPAKVGTFFKNFKKPTWYPKYVPSGYKLDTVDIIEMGTKTGLVCDIVFLNGEKALLFTQGSPTERDYEVVSAGKVAWGSGSDKADIMYQDPEDTSTPPMIIYSKGGTFIELQGDPSLAELKKVAASMVPVK